MEEGLNHPITALQVTVITGVKREGLDQTIHHDPSRPGSMPVAGGLGRTSHPP